jgi:hypothetical protein
MYLDDEYKISKKKNCKIFKDILFQNKMKHNSVYQYMRLKMLDSFFRFVSHGHVRSRKEKVFDNHKQRLQRLYGRENYLKVFSLLLADFCKIVINLFNRFFGWLA